MIVSLENLQSLEELIYKPVRITTKSGEIYEGEFSSYTSAEDSEDGMDYIGIEYSTHIESFNQSMIESIEILDQPVEISFLDFVKQKFSFQ